MKSTPVFIAALFVCAAGCDNNDDTPAEDGEEATAGEGSSEDGGDNKDDIEALYECDEPNLIEAMPLSGPGYDPQAGLIDPQETYIAFSTQIIVDPENQDLFNSLVADVSAQMATSEGFVASALAIEPTCGFARTLGVWRSDAEMYRFVGTGAHAEAMTHTATVAITGKTTSWQITAQDMPLTWEMAKAQLAEVEPLGRE